MYLHQAGFENNVAEIDITLYRAIPPFFPKVFHCTQSLYFYASVKNFCVYNIQETAVDHRMWVISCPDINI